MSRSSIFSFDTLRLARRDVVRGLGFGTMVVLFITLTSAALEAVEPVDLHGGWGQFQLERGRERVQAYVKKHGHVDVMLFGNSVFRAVDVAIIERAWTGVGLVAYNASIGGSRPEGQAFVLEHVFLPLVTPRVLIYEIGPRDLLDPKKVKRRKQEVFQSVRARALLADTLSERVESALEERLYVFAARRELRRGLTHGIEAREAKDIGENGVGEDRPARLLKQLAGKTAFGDIEYRNRYAPYRVDKRGAQQDVRDVIAIAKRAGIEVILLNMPISPACFSLFDDPMQDYALYLNTLRGIVADTGVAFFDMHTDLGLPNADFANADHPAKAGNDKIARYIADRVMTDYVARHR